MFISVDENVLTGLIYVPTGETYNYFPVDYSSFSIIERSKVSILLNLIQFVCVECLKLV